MRAPIHPLHPATDTPDGSAAPASRGLLRLLSLFCVAIALLAAGASQASAAETHIFDETLSLTGDCSTSLLDQIPDPGICPMPPGVAGVDHPSTPFQETSVAVDTYGDLYVASAVRTVSSNYHVDVFGPDGDFITEIPISLEVGSGVAIHIDVDSQGNFYVYGFYEADHHVFRYAPSAYEPSTGDIEYAKPPILTPISYEANWAVNPANDRVFDSNNGGEIIEYGSAAEGNAVLDRTPSGFTSAARMAIDAARGRIYLSVLNKSSSPGKFEVGIFELAPPHALLGTLDGAETPAGSFQELFKAPLAVDEDTGHLFFGELFNQPRKRVYEFEVEEDAAGELHERYLSTIERSFAAASNGPSIAVDNAPTSPASGTLYVPSGIAPNGHIFAFRPVPPPTPPTIESVSVTGISPKEAVLHAKINPEGLPTAYRFEYTTRQHYDAEGGTFAGAVVAREGTLAAENAGIELSAPLSGLQPGTAYRFRVVAENDEGQVETQRAFATYPTPAIFSGCPNEALRTGASAALPDCRAYELVTPWNTAGRRPVGLPRFFDERVDFATRNTSPAGDAVSFMVQGGGIPGFDGSGAFSGDAYVSTRQAGGWQTAIAGVNGVANPNPNPGSVSADQHYSFYLGAGNQTFLRYPDGHSVPIGRGSLGSDPAADGEWISSGGSHVIFTSGAELEGGAPPAPTTAVYDRTIDPANGVEQTHVVSLLPGNVTPAGGEPAFYAGNSADGRGIAFTIGKKLYLRYEGETYEVGEGLTFAGLSEGGEQIFFLRNGDLWRFDVEGNTTTRFTESGDVTVVNVAAAGGVAYFVSPGVLAGANPRGEFPEAGEENLYRSEEGHLSFIGTVTERDVVGPSEENGGPVNFPFDGLGLWVKTLNGTLPAAEASRTNPNGTALLFSSRADLTGFDSEGRPELYRYDSAAATLACLSCPPTAISSGSGAALLTMSQGKDTDTFLLGRTTVLENLRPDSRRAFFESTEPLVPADADGVRDVYEWEDDGVGSCHTPGGCVYLISSGRSARPNYLYAVSESGNDVFIETTDLLLPSEDPDETPSVYDARVEGGFAAPPPPPGECLGEACQPAASPPPAPAIASSVFNGAGNVTQPHRKACPKHRRRVNHKGRSRCVGRHRHRHHADHQHRKQTPNRRVGR
jgi:hypothetical protein